MAFFLFVDESGFDRKESPYEVLAGLCVEDHDVWNLISALKDAEERVLGVRYSREKEEIKGKKFLKRKVFRQAGQRPPFPEAARRDLARDCILNGASATTDQIAALAQAKLAFVAEALDICGRFHCRAFASVVDVNAPRPLVDVLRKDYAFLFERFFYFLEDQGPAVQGAVVFDELERSQSHVLIGQMERYFLGTATGRTRSQQVIPEPFFVHSDLTSLVQVADLMAYIISWGLRIPGQLDAPARAELAPLAAKVGALRYRASREILGNPNFVIWSVAVIKDLRGWEDRQ
jgi:hypothetical protein